MTNTGEVRRLLGEMANAAEEFGREEAARAVRAEQARLGAGAATVVVVGVKQRGKSSLINAIVERPGLLPVDADVATNVHLTVRHADEPVAHVFEDADEAGRVIRIDEIAEYGALDPATQVPRDPEVRHVEVGLPSPLLAEAVPDRHAGRRRARRGSHRPHFGGHRTRGRPTVRRERIGRVHRVGAPVPRPDHRPDLDGGLRTGPDRQVRRVAEDPGPKP
ncbi:hypothetical protein Psi02_72260 [Planotetraspora silvatica]|uniref:Dynamin N-terminal domain-containing protein n=1 Tax=Planotetraspora silvatica TaxID=234614 RepID=A0A8J3UVW5_9ACTN|nr:hypothetical protein Psi02_72260 [Planotetraspora silvatica]